MKSEKKGEKKTRTKRNEETEGKRIETEKKRPCGMKIKKGK